MPGGYVTQSNRVYARALQKHRITSQNCAKGVEQEALSLALLTVQQGQAPIHDDDGKALAIDPRKEAALESPPPLCTSSGEFRQSLRGPAR